IWREVITRRQRYIELRSHIDNGDITSINDFITYNLDIRQFTLDLLNETNNTQLVYQFYKALKTITILDPTCGSGAFLFAAMNILEDLYEVCLIRIHEFDIENPGRISKDIKNDLEIIKSSKHPNLQYYIYKSIILNNLYGVDIMPEAVEIAKLRLFLKLVASVDPDPNHINYGLEPLPDIDFNIRCGNTLVGYANWDEIMMDIESDAITAAENREELPILCDKVAMAYERYKQIQLLGYDDFANFSQARALLHGQLQELTDRLDRMLHQHSSSIPFDKWKESHQPFHWVAEFYEIIHSRKGFDVIIGNPPYVESSKVVYSYNHASISICGNLYPLVMHRSYLISSNRSYFGMIVPISLASTPRMNNLRQYLTANSESVWCSNYADRPGCLFKGVHQKLSIILCKLSSSQTGEAQINTTQYYHWYGSDVNAVENLFQTCYYLCNSSRINGWYKFGHYLDNSLYKVIDNLPMTQAKSKSGFSIYLNMRMMYWCKCFMEPKKSNEYKQITYNDRTASQSACAAFNSSLFFWLWETLSDVWHITNKELEEFRFGVLINSSKQQEVLSKETLRLMEDLETNKRSVMTKQTDYEYYHKLSKSIIDEIDTTIAKYLGLNQNELDYVINYNLKFRNGGAAGTSG
ncbi:MAG: Eco57I restriction-modification methylase domain-containing protein, partial [Candidatus Cloacimonetes bacterium]|nr:Eco57I restriction-modification methylase domain-containing protein [Candidatus Cloacimonadota bacterium]